MALAIIYFGDLNDASVEYMHSEDMLFHYSQLCVDMNEFNFTSILLPPPPKICTIS